jgi:hypothetical protein
MQPRFFSMNFLQYLVLDRYTRSERHNSLQDRTGYSEGSQGIPQCSPDTKSRVVHKTANLKVPNPYTVVLEELASRAERGRNCYIVTTPDETFGQLTDDLLRPTTKVRVIICNRMEYLHQRSVYSDVVLSKSIWK